MNAQFPRFFRFLFKNTIWKIKTSSKVIYLTFDDGPIPEVTYDVLNILDEYGWKANFFCVGDNVKKYPEVYSEVLKRGHRTGNHTFNHLKGFSSTDHDYLDNVEKAAEYIKSDLFRPPHGRIKNSQLKVLSKKYRVVMWDVITYDYDKSESPNGILKRLKRYLRPGSIVVFHDSLKAKENVLTALPEAIRFWQERGYTHGLL